ncbi:MAG: hypothetical protein KGH74_04945 [Candidatus Micrarchaeota archaeon]|nr:hypothetical protein [Candidatus Micrarchaeota archaeon]MDE1824612.1 hypothetical protein [Candidatus Micrarchaeota archaeon]
MNATVAKGQKLELVTKVLVRADVPSTMNKGIRSSGRTEAVDLGMASQEHALYKQAIRNAGGKVIEMPVSRHPDSLYVQDTAYIVAGPGSDWKPVAIIANPGNPERRKEVGEIKEFISSLNIEIKEIKGKNAFIEFGDVEKVDGVNGGLMVIGLSERTNWKGASKFIDIVREIEPMAFQLQDIKGVLHLTTGMTPVHPELFLKSPYLVAPIMLPNWIEVVELGEKDAYAANVLRINGGIVVPEGFKTVKDIALKHYDAEKVQEVPTSQTQILNGSLTCASIVWQELARE